MSITFYADRNPTIKGWAASCYRYGAPEYRGEIYPTEAAAKAAHDDEHSANDGDGEYCDFEICRPVYDTDADPQVNMSNSNAHRVAELLGLTQGKDQTVEILSVEYTSFDCGSMEADEFIGAVLIAQALTPQDAGVATMEHRTEGGARVISMGRPEGYLQARLDQLLAVGEFAKKHQARVCWC